jgi:hypothetical protein
MMATLFMTNAYADEDKTAESTECEYGDLKGNNGFLLISMGKKCVGRKCPHGGRNNRQCLLR